MLGWGGLVVTVVLWVAILVRKHGLLACILENVVGFKTGWSGRQPTSDHWMKILALFLPEFSWRVDTLALSDYMRPQSRVRVFIRGLRRSVAESVPPCLPPFGKCALRNVLVLGWPTHPRDRLTKQQQQNLLDYEETIRNLYHVGKALPDDIVVVALDRAKGNVFRQNYRINQVPTLTCNNRYLFLMSVADVINQVEDKNKEFFRFLLETERLTLQGFPPEAARDFPSDGLVLKATGNAYPPPLIMAAAAPLIQAMGADRPAGDNFNFSTWPADWPSFQSDIFKSVLDDFAKRLVSPPPFTEQGTLGLAICFTLQSWAKTCSMNRAAQIKTNTHDP